MKKWFAGLGFGIALLTASASASAAGAVPGNEGVQARAQPQPIEQTAPNVESVDILKQNQAERTRDQPGNGAPTWRIVNSGHENYSSLPYLEAGVLIQPKARFPGQAKASSAGEAWRRFRNGPLTHIGGWLLIAAAVGVAAMYFIKGPIKLKAGRTGRLIERFTSLERITHWTVAISFVLLALSGLTMLFGKYVLLPVFGHPLFGWLAYALKNIHNFVGPVFAVSIIVFFAILVKDNLPQAADIKWATRLGGALGKEHVGAERFNTGEKLWFWGGMVALGLTVSASGFVLDMLVPGIAYPRATMQLANVVHLVAAVLIAAFAFGHIYMGTIGMEGAYAAMRTGYVDDTWAKEHHELWYRKIESGEIARVRTPEAAEKIGGPAKAV
jgi:formate dehydrogenase subunit gamma